MAAKNGGKTILGNVASTLSSYPVGQKFCRNRSILQVESNFMFFAVLAKTQNSHHFWGEENVLKIDKSIFLVGENFDKIALSRTVKEIEEN